MVAYAWIMLACFAIPVLAGTWHLLAHCWRTHAVEPYVAEDATPPSAYASAMIESATRDHGYRWLGAARNADHPKARYTLLIGDADATLALVSAAYTTLETRLAGGRSFVTSDITFVSFDPTVAYQTLINADFDELRRLHAAGLENTTALPWPADVGWTKLNERSRAGVGRIVERGRARFARGGDRYRYTLRAALRLTLGETLRQIWNPPDVKRLYKRRPGTGATERADEVAQVAAEDSINRSP